MPETIVVLDPLAPERADKLRALLPPGFVLTHGTARGDDHLKEIIAEADYAISGQVGVSGDVLRAARKLKLLHKWGVGVDNLDTATARELGIKVARTTGSNAVPVAEFALGLKHAALGELLAQSDVVSLHCPLTPQTANMIDKAAFAAMKKTAVLINVARGGIVKENDLIEALRTRQIAGAAMDVFETEPLPPDSPLLGIDNLVVTPHLAAIASDIFAPTVKRMFDNIARVARGEAVPERDSVV